MDSWQLAQLAEIQATVAEIEAAKALNAYREMRGETIAYDEVHFQGLANYLHRIANALMEHYQG